ncbi:DUF255 domain-containing protein [Brevibacillus sp. SYP-B805]|nr:DUF255 domain-containing protein [Brevibacillus sp. SYP-B805]
MGGLHASSRRLVPWGEEAFSRAKKISRCFEHRLFHTTCHWCRVYKRRRYYAFAKSGRGG